MLVLGESIALAGIGAVLGVTPMSLALIAFPLRKLNFGPISAVEVSPVSVVGSLLLALLVGTVAGIWPAWQAMRLRTADALRRVA
jgi:ABC-type antimicrobial peptide transport system permease subunit